MKRLFVNLLILVSIVSLAGCGSKKFEAGTYQGGAPGIHGKDIVVEVTVDSKTIQDITILENHETPGLSDAAFNRIPAQVLKQQDLNVDSVAGATITSFGLIGAITEALESAGADIAKLTSGSTSDADAVSAATEVMNADVVVIGAGGAGLSAAISAHQNGSSVIVLEKMPMAGGNTMISGSAYNAADPSRQIPQGIEDSADLHFEQTFDGGDRLGNPDLVRVLVDNAYPTIEWLESMGMEFNDTVFTVLGGLWPRAHKPVKPLGTGYMETYMNYINSHDDITVVTDATVNEIFLKEGRANLLNASTPANTLVVGGHKGIIIATGGFGANVEMRDRYNANWPSLTNIKTTNHPGATGDGLALAEKIGADLIDLENIQLLPMGDPNTGSLSGNIEQAVENRIFINKSGDRFVDEGERRDVMTSALFDQEDQYMWIVLDSEDYPTLDTRNNFNETMQELLDQGRAVMADTLEELALLMDVDAENLVAAVETFNDAVENGNDPFGRTLFERKIDTPPYFAGPRMPTVHHTMGGIRINEKAQVLDKEGNTIPGLYAAGETTGGVHGGNRLGGNALADINVFGRIAGANAAAEIID
ncbi:MAG: flavocytochrome c [Spirochaetales bacterium]|nr:flavocytochrome c [Spirochaetales bacterium]